MSWVTDLTQGAASGLFAGLGSLISTVTGAITGKTPLTPEEQGKVMERLSALQAQAVTLEQAIAAGQADIDKIDAASSNPIQRLWRPCVGWVCVLGLGYQFLFCPVLPWILQVVAILTKHPALVIPSLPALDTGTLMPLLIGILGLGTMRTIEKIKGAD
jgi:hypothetical protein